MFSAVWEDSEPQSPISIRVPGLQSRQKSMKYSLPRHALELAAVEFGPVHNLSAQMSSGRIGLGGELSTARLSGCGSGSYVSGARLCIVEIEAAGQGEWRWAEFLAEIQVDLLLMPVRFCSPRLLSKRRRRRRLAVPRGACNTTAALSTLCQALERRRAPMPTPKQHPVT